MSHTQINKPESLNLDKSTRYLTEKEAFYLLNHNIYDLLGKSVPNTANYPACELEQPTGEVYTCGVYRSPLTNEVYSWHYNSNGVHYILRISESGCGIVYSRQHNCFDISAEPEHFISNFRAYLKIEKICHNRHGKQLIWVNGKGEIGMLDTEASIATNSFTTPFFDKCHSDCAPVQMCVPRDCACITAKYVPIIPSELSKSNHILDKGFKFMYRFVYYDNRASEWSDRSTLYFQDTKGCFDNSEGFPRCMELEVPLGNPMVDKIEIAYTKGDKDTNGNNDIWYLYDTVDKYKKYTNAQQYWYERELSEEVALTTDGCSLLYKFCNDKQCKIIPHKEVERVVNPYPREAQGLIPIKDALGFYNYKKGSCPIDKKEIEKFKIELGCSDEHSNCAPEYVDVTVRAIVHNFTHDRNQFVYREKDGSTDDVTDTAKFGGLNKALSGGIEDPIGYDQYFKDKVRNFIVYIEGTDQYGEMKQYHSEAYFKNPSYHGIVGDMGHAHTRNLMRKEARQGNFFYQQHTFKVAKGTKGFIRMASHRAVGNEQGSSTFVVGVIDSIGNYKGHGSVNYNSNTEEIYFDTCGKDKVELVTSFIIQDNAVDTGASVLGGVVGAVVTGSGIKASSFYGYIRDESGTPLEGLVIGIPFAAGGPDIDVSTTDHNGFFHFYSQNVPQGDVKLHVKGEVDCAAFKLIKTVSVTSEKGTATKANITIEKEDSLPFLNSSILKVTIPVKDCNGAPVSGITVALSGSKHQVTDGHGIANFKIRNYNSRSRVLKALVIDHHGCFGLGCDGKCNPCFQSFDIPTRECYFVAGINGNPPQLYSVSSPDFVLNRNSAEINRKGLKNGGRYPLGIIVEGDCGRLSAAYGVTYIDIPKAQENKKVSYCDLKFTDLGMKFPSWGTCLKIVRGENINPFELQWLVDKIDRVDGKIKITIQSLNDYNEKYNFKVNAHYQFLQGDRIEFIKNGDGKYFDITKGVINYLALSPFHDVLVSGQKDAPADYFNQILIDDDGKLDDLKIGATIELQRQKDCITEPVYFEVCAKVPIVENDNHEFVLAVQTGSFFTFDTYLVNRSVGSFPSQSFEHHSPSDFWGNRITDVGKPHFTNKYENEKRVGRSISISSPTQINYFGDLEKTFEAPEQGDIVAMDIKDGKIILAIGEHDNFMAQSADEFVRVGSDGTIRALPADAIISDQQPKVRGQFGCKYEDIGSIYFGDGFATWVDSDRHALVKHDYGSAKNISFGKIAGFLTQKIQDIKTNNRKVTSPLDKMRFSTGVNMVNGGVNITVKALRHSGINNEKRELLQPNETIVFNPETEDMLTFASFTPEAYSYIELYDGNGCAFISYLHGHPYIHPKISDKFNEYYGVAVDRVIGISLNKFPDKLKIALAMEVQDKKMWYAHEVTTEMSGFKSEIPPIRWKESVKGNGKWNAEFLFDINGRGGLYGNAKVGGSAKAMGYAIDIVMVRDNTDALKYNTVDNKKRVEYDELDNFFTKFMFSESSGFTETP